MFFGKVLNYDINTADWSQIFVFYLSKNNVVCELALKNTIYCYDFLVKQNKN